MSDDITQFLDSLGGAENASKLVYTVQDKISDYLGADIVSCSIAFYQSDKEAEIFYHQAISLLTGLLLQGKINLIKKKK